jgi:hypothetical protein
MGRVKLGDIIEIRTPGGVAYAQYINRHRMYGALLRVFSTLHKARPAKVQLILNDDVQFVCFFPLQAAVNQDIVTPVGNAPVPPDAAAMPVFRNGVMDPDTGKVAVWWFWDGENEWKVGALTDEQKKMPILGCWNDTFLIERIVSGWRPENDPTT